MKMNPEKMAYSHVLYMNGEEIHVREMIPYEEKEQFA